MNKTKSELIKRMTEAGAIIQWMNIVADRRGSNPEAPHNRAQQWASEKEFLLIHSHSIDANPEGITADYGSAPEGGQGGPVPVPVKKRPSKFEYKMVTV